MQLIDRHALLKNVYDNPPEKARMTYAEWCRKCIYEAPTIEPEVRHGRWAMIIINIGGGDKIRMFQCSECSSNANMKFYFCPNCGADMRATDTNVGYKGGADNG